MKKNFRAGFFLAMGLLLIACGQSVRATPSPIPSPSATATGTLTSVPSQTAIAPIEPTSRPEHVPPTLIPTIDPTLVPGLLSKAFSIQTIEGVNGYNMQRITGWDYGFGGEYRYGICPGYRWLDTNHILLYPEGGQQVEFIDGASRAINVVPQPVVMNLDNGVVWLPPTAATAISQTCNRMYWSKELKILITSEVHDEVSTVSTYTYDGHKLVSYPGSLLDVSPSGTKILLTDETAIDLRTNKKVELNWDLEDYWEFYWTSDETRIYRCCYYYADLITGMSYRFKRSDFQTSNGNHLDDSGLWFHSGFWVLDDAYFLVWWHAVDDGDIKYLPLFDPATKIFHDVREMAGIPEEFTSLYTPVSSDGNYVWMEGWNESYLVNLTTFESQHYTYSNPYSNTEIDWSSDSKFTWFEINDMDAKSAEFKILSISDMKLHPLPVIPPIESEHLWHPTENIVVYPAKDKNTLIFLDASTMSIRELPFTFEKTPYTYGDFTWSPNGEKIALTAADNSLWQVDYPNLEDLEQLTPSLSDVSNVNWSPDGNSIAFTSGSDIYVVEAIK